MHVIESACYRCNQTGYCGPTGDTCPTCEGNGWYEIQIQDEDDFSNDDGEVHGIDNTMI